MAEIESIRVVSVISKKRHPRLYEELISRPKYYRSRCIKDLSEEMLGGTGQQERSIKPSQPRGADEVEVGLGNKNEIEDISDSVILTPEASGSLSVNIPSTESTLGSDEVESRRALLKQGIKNGFD